MDMAARERKRLVVVTAGNLRQSHFYIREHYDFFPPDCLGPSTKASAADRGELEILLDGLDEVVKTDIGTDGKTGKPRAFFRRRAWVRRFFEHHNVRPGDKLALERLGKRRYRLSVDRPHSNGRSPTVAEFFSGIGLVRLALERQGWRVVFANDIDPDKAEMYRHNWPEDDHLLLGDNTQWDPIEMREPRMQVDRNIGFDGRTFLDESEWTTYRRRKPVRYIRERTSTRCEKCGLAETPDNPLQSAHVIGFDMGVIELALTPEFLDSSANIVTAHRRICNKGAEVSLPQAMKRLRSLGITALPQFLPSWIQKAWLEMTAEATATNAV
jgi:hypothetical protein